jgi:hypothetical protein
MSTPVTNNEEEAGAAPGRMSEPLNREHSSSSFQDDDNASQSSQRSSSLLERIRMQREREKQQQKQTQGQGAQQNPGAASASSSRTPSQMQIQVPQYSPVPTLGSDNVNLATGRPDPTMMSSSDNGAAAPMGRNSNPFAGDSPEDGGGASGFFRSAWSNIATSMETGMAGLQGASSGHGGMGEDGNYLLDSSDMEDALLMMPTASRFGGAGGTSVDEDYSMCNYFLTFVRDVYLAFVSVPVPGRVIIVIVLLYAAIKLL